MNCGEAENLLARALESLGCFGCTPADQAFLSRLCATLDCELLLLDADKAGVLRDHRALPLSMLALVLPGNLEIARAQGLDAILPDAPIIRLAGEPITDELTVTRAVATARGERYRSLAKAHSENARSLAGLRRMFNDSQDAFVELERFLERHALLRVRTTFSVAPGSDSVVLRGDGDGLEQPLPFDAFGLALVRLALSDSLAAGSALEAELLFGTDVAQSWRFEGPLPAGSIALPLKNAATEQFRVPSLRLRAVGPGAAVRLPLAAERLGIRWSARLGVRDLGRSIALSTGFAPPGITLPDQAATRTDPSRLHIVVQDWRNIEFGHEPVKHGWQVVQAEDGYLQAHPLVGAPTLIWLRDIDLTGFSRIRADIRLSHAGAPQIGFAIAMLEPGRQGRLRLRDRDLSWSRGASSWFTLKGEESGLAFLDIEAQGHADIALVTSCFDKKADFAWARWGAVVLER